MPAAPGRSQREVSEALLPLLDRLDDVRGRLSRCRLHHRELTVSGIPADLGRLRHALTPSQDPVREHRRPWRGLMPDRSNLMQPSESPESIFGQRGCSTGGFGTVGRKSLLTSKSE